MTDLTRAAALLSPRIARFLNAMRGVYNVMDYGGIGDNSADDRAAILDAVAAAYAGGGGTVTTSPGKIHRYSGRLRLRPGVKMDFGRDATTTPAATILYATSADGGVDLVGGSHLRATMRTTNASWVGPMLDIDDTKSTELGFGRNSRHATFDVDMQGNRQAGCVGLRFHSASNANGGVSWVNGSATIGEIDYGCVMETSATGYINENWIDLVVYASREALVGTKGGGEIAANRIRLTSQTDSNPRAKRVIRWDGVNNMIEVNVWDWAAGRTDSSTDSAVPIHLTSLSGGNQVRGICARAGGFNGFLTSVVLDESSRTTNKNHIHISSGRFHEGVNLVRNMPANSFEQTYCGDQDDSFSYATRRYTVSVSGTTTPDAASQRRLFEPNEANLVVASCVDFTVKVDLGVAPGKIAGMGVSFSSTLANRPTSVRVQGSTDDSTWVTIMEAGFVNDPVPQHLFRTDQPGSYRYWRLVVTGDGSQAVHINRWWAVDLGFTRLPGMFMHIHDPVATGNLTLNGRVMIGAASAAPTTGTHQRGAVYWNTTPSAGGVPGWMCTETGTLTAIATTGDITSGTPTLEVASASGIAVGVYLTIAGVSGVKRVIAVSGTTITLDSNASATVSGAAVANSAAVFKAMASLAA